MATSWIHAAVRFGFELTVACPSELPPPQDVLDWARREKDPFAEFPMVEHPPLQNSAGNIIKQPVTNVLIEIGWQGPSIGKDDAATYAADSGLHWEGGVHTQLGGILFLVNLMIALDLPECFEQDWRMANRLGPWGVLQMTKPGPNTITVFVVDAAGNRSAPSNQRVVTGYYTPGCTPYHF